MPFPAWTPILPSRRSSWTSRSSGSRHSCSSTAPCGCRSSAGDTTVAASSERAHPTSAPSSNSSRGTYVSSWDDLRLQVTPGNGLVARSAAALLVVPVVAPHQQSVLEQLLALTRSAQPAAGRALARRLAGIVASSEPEDVPDLAFFADLASENVAVLVLGEAEVSADTSTG